MNKERTGKSVLRQVEHIRDHLWHRCSVTVNQVIVATVKQYLSKYHNEFMVLFKHFTEITYRYYLHYSVLVKLFVSGRNCCSWSVHHYDLHYTDNIIQIHIMIFVSNFVNVFCLAIALSVFQFTASDEYFVITTSTWNLIQLLL
jgi:hypothetical protein